MNLDYCNDKDASEKMFLGFIRLRVTEFDERVEQERCFEAGVI